jgi:hypothetical protein
MMIFEKQRTLFNYSDVGDLKKSLSVKDFKKPWSVKEKRCFHRISSGCKIALYQKKRLRCITLTSSDIANTENDISRDVDVLIKRIRRKYPEFEYLKVNVLKSGRWHVHMLYKGSFMPFRWLKYQWSVIHHSPIVRITEMDGSYGLVNYFARQYLASQEGEFTYMSYSQGWIFKGAISVWKRVLRSCRDYSDTYWDFSHGGFWHFSIDLKKVLSEWNRMIYLRVLGFKVLPFQALPLEAFG